MPKTGGAKKSSSSKNSVRKPRKKFLAERAKGIKDRENAEAGLLRAAALKGDVAEAAAVDEGLPKSLVIKRGKLGRSARELVDDLRLVMSPLTARKLKEKRSNNLKDFVNVAGVLGVTHLIALSQTDVGPNLRICRMPRGPTLTFRVMNYSLMSHVRSSQKRPISSREMFSHSPLVVLNNFEGKGRQVQMVATMFRAMFPAINVQTVKLSECKRVLLIEYNQEDDIYEVRSYFIRAEPQVSRSVRKLVGEKLPNLGDHVDVSEIMDAGAYGNPSDSEAEDPSSAVVLPDNFGRGNVKGKRSVVKLREIGPRLSLSLLKVEAGVFEGEVVYHKLSTKTSEEVNELRTKAEDRAKTAEARRLQQEENVERKRKLEEEKAEAKRLKLEKRKSKLTGVSETVIDQPKDDNEEEEELRVNKRAKRMKRQERRRAPVENDEEEGDE